MNHRTIPGATPERDASANENDSASMRLPRATFRLDVPAGATAPTVGEASRPHSPAARDSVSAPDQEDVFDPAPAQRRTILYRRDGLLRPPPVRVNSAAALRAAQAFVPQAGVALDALRRTDPGSTGPARHGGADPDDMSAREAAVLLGYVSETSTRANQLALFDHWLESHGVAVAVHIALEMGVLPSVHNPRGSVWHYRYSSPADRACQDAGYRAILRRVRNALAAAPDDEARRTRTVLADHRDQLDTRVITSYLLPSERDWVAADIADIIQDCRDRPHHKDAADASHLLIDAVPDTALLHRLGEVTRPSSRHHSALRWGSSVLTLVNAIGFTATAILDAWLDDWRIASGLEQPIAYALATIPTDDAFAALAGRNRPDAVPEALRRAAQRFPRRALRLLDAQRHTDILRDHVIAHADLARDMLPGLSPATAAVVSTEVFQYEAAPAPDEGDIPEILRNPPWLDRQHTRQRPAIELAAPSGVSCHWLPGEQQEWLAHLAHTPVLPDVSLDAFGPDLSAWQLETLAHCDRDRDRVRAIVRTARLDRTWHDVRPLRTAAAAFETDAYEMLLGKARSEPREVDDALDAFRSPELVDLMITRLDRRTVRPAALRYLRRNAEFTASVLIPRALGRATKGRYQAVRVLRLLEDLGHGTEIRSSAAEYDVGAAVHELLTADPLRFLPQRIPDVPNWMNITALPTIRTTAGHPLPPEAVRTLIIMLALGHPDQPYAGVRRIQQACAPADLAKLAWQLFSQWLQGRAPAAHSWVYDALGTLGDDTTVEALAEFVQRQSHDPRAVTVLDAFVAIGSDAALLALKFISEQKWTKRVRTGAAERIGAVAARLGLTPDQLADRLVPDLGLDGDGTMVLDFGPRRFTVGFDEQLRPTLTAGSGARVKALPKPGVKDDPELAAQAHKDFRRLTKEVRTFAGDQIARMERAMVFGRRFDLAELREGFVDHPLRWHIARRLLWAVCVDDAVTTTFRIAEDRTFADADDNLVIPPDDAVLVLPHPVQFPDHIAGWSEIFADYELLQPFPQIGREVCTVPDELRAAAEIPSDATEIYGTRFLGLPRRGWLPIEREYGDYLSTFEKPLPHEHFLEVHADPGLSEPNPREDPLQTFTARLCRTRATAGDLTFAELDPVTASEVLRDIAWLKAGHP